MPGTAGAECGGGPRPVPTLGLRLLAAPSTNRVVKNSLYNLCGLVMPALLLLIFTPTLVHHMGTESYGLWTLAVSVLGLMGVVEFGLGTAIAKYVAQYTSSYSSEGLSATVTTGFAVYLAIGFLFTMPLYFLAPHIARFFPTSSVSLDRIEGAIRLVSLGFVPLLLKSAGLAVPTGLQRFEIQMAITIGQQVLMYLAVVSIVALGGSVEDVILSTVLSMWFTALGTVVIAVRMLRALGGRILFSFEYFRKILSFMAFAGAANVGGQVFGSLDRIAVGTVLGIEAVSYYSVAIGVASKLLSLSGVLTSALMPAASSWHAAGDTERILKYLKRSTVAVGLLNACVGGSLLLFSGAFMRLWMGNAFAEQALAPFRILVLVYAVISINAPAYYVANGIGIPWICALGALVGGGATVGLIIALGHLIGLQGAAWANAGYWLTLVIVFYTGDRLRRSLKAQRERPHAHER